MWKKGDKTIPKGLHWQCVGHPAWFGPGAGRWFLFKSWQQPFGNLEQSSISIVEAVPFWVKSKVPRGHRVTNNLIAVSLKYGFCNKVTKTLLQNPYFNNLNFYQKPILLNIEFFDH